MTVAWRSSCAVRGAVPAAIFGRRSASSSRVATQALRVSESAVSSRSIEIVRWPTIGPASGASVISCRVTPVSASPSTSTQLIGARPRNLGSSEACRLNPPREEREELRGDHLAVVRRDERVGLHRREALEPDRVVRVFRREDRNAVLCRFRRHRAVPAALLRIVAVGQDRDHVERRGDEGVERRGADLVIGEEDRLHAEGVGGSGARSASVGVKRADSKRGIGVAARPSPAISWTK